MEYLFMTHGLLGVCSDSLDVAWAFCICEILIQRRFLRQGKKEVFDYAWFDMEMSSTETIISLFSSILLLLPNGDYIVRTWRNSV